ncbi:MAG TPA: DUF1700 domain-containing protein [Paenibacillus sp.]|jgi:uncharacterized membrane protein
MNKNEFLAILNAHLSVLPPEERNELMNDYETHFAFGLQNGKTEAEIVHELGNPEELAKEAIGDRQIPQQQVYWSDPRRPQQDSPATPTKTRGTFATVMVCIGLFFLNLIAVPSLVALWCFGVSFVLMAVSGLLSPLALLFEYLLHGVFFPAKGFAVVVLIGVGILFTIISRYTIKGLLKISSKYLAWNKKVLEGGETE